ncbi:hypothetical protein QQF64_005104 [Cirrhinus molitorella]|uniref:Uncharacterized protein n=1 Tax=Cirrhinus molitorella TaxID=172907 RepID=A0ABR3MKE0_9TELE
MYTCQSLERGAFRMRSAVSEGEITLGEGRSHFGNLLHESDVWQLPFQPTLAMKKHYPPLKRPGGFHNHLQTESYSYLPPTCQGPPLLIAHKYEYKTHNTKSHFGTKAPLPRNLAVCDFTTRASCLGFLRSPPMLRDVPPRAFMCSARARIKQASVVGSCVCESEREQQLPVFLSPSCCIRLSCAIWMDVVELRRWSSETLLFHFLSRFLTTRCQSAVWQRWWCGEDAPVVRMTQTQRNSQSRLIHK